MHRAFPRRYALALLGPLLVTTASIFGTPTPAADAQVLPIHGIRVHDILQHNGTRIGIIYVDRESVASKQYVEHWVMFDTYTYPSMLWPSADRYDGAADFLARVPFRSGFSYARWDVSEQRRIAGR
jgi:hypothetical protein